MDPLTHKPYWSKISLLIQLARLLEEVPGILLVWMDDDIVAIDVFGDNLGHLWQEMIIGKKALAVNSDFHYAGHVNTGVIAVSLDNKHSTMVLNEVCIFCILDIRDYYIHLPCTNPLHQNRSGNDPF